jgi:hypothetical protein
MKVQSYVLIEHHIARKEQECFFSTVHHMVLRSFSYCPVVGAVCPGAMWRKAQKSLCKALALFFMI